MEFPGPKEFPRDFPGKFDSSNVSRDNVSRRIRRNGQDMIYIYIYIYHMYIYIYMYTHTYDMYTHIVGTYNIYIYIYIVSRT